MAMDMVTAMATDIGMDMDVTDSMEMTNMRMRRNKVYTTIGVAALILLMAVFAAAVWKNRSAHTPVEQGEVSGRAVLKFEPEELVYDGTGEMDLIFRRWRGFD